MQVYLDICSNGTEHQQQKPSPGRERRSPVHGQVHPSLPICPEMHAMVTLSILTKSFLSRDGGGDLDIQNRLNKARISFNMMRKVWRSSTCSTRTKQLCLHNSELESRPLTEKDFTKLSSFHTKSLLRILRIFFIGPEQSQIKICSNGVEPNPWLPS